MNSMSGFYNISNKFNGSLIDITIKSYNNRFLDIKINLPKEYSFLESKIRDVIKKKIHRGSVYLYINKINSGKTARVDVDMELVKKISNAYRAIFSSLKTDINLNSNLFEQAVKIEKNVSNLEEKQIYNLVRKAVAKLALDRKKEGTATKIQISVILKKLLLIISRIEKVKFSKTDINKKFSDVKKNSNDVDLSKLAYEIVFNLDKMEISEELARLKEHIRGFKKDMISLTPIGKKLDFYTQELLREVNTIGAKSNKYQTNKLAIEAKLLIEQIKEQVQNIE